MEQRSLRLGDIVDDYCPRERRVTNHAIVALVGDSIRQTRCATCDAEHEYKEGRMPRKKVLRNGESSDLAGGVLVTPRIAGNGHAPEAPDSMSASPDDTQPAQSDPHADAATSPSNDGQGAEGAQDADGNRAGPDGWFSHRPLIRATLPRTEGDPPPQPRAIPEFTMHQRPGRGFGGRGFRGGGGYQGFNGNGSGNGMPGRDPNGNGPDGNRGSRPGKGRHRRRHRRPR